jgi:hypothetical protein
MYDTASPMMACVGAETFATGICDDGRDKKILRIKDQVSEYPKLRTKQTDQAFAVKYLYTTLTSQHGKMCIVRFIGR